MPEAMTAVLATLVGVALGAFFFGGLWWTVRRGVASARPAVWFLGSVLLRTSVVLAGFYLVARGGHPIRLLLGLLGFIAARVLVMRGTRRGDAARTSRREAAGHAA